MGCACSSDSTDERSTASTGRSTLTALSGSRTTAVRGANVSVGEGSSFPRNTSIDAQYQHRRQLELQWLQKRRQDSFVMASRAQSPQATSASFRDSVELSAARTHNSKNYQNHQSPGLMATPTNLRSESTRVSPPNRLVDQSLEYLPGQATGGAGAGVNGASFSRSASPYVPASARLAPHGSTCDQWQHHQQPQQQQEEPRHQEEEEEGERRRGAAGGNNDNAQGEEGAGGDEPGTAAAVNMLLPDPSTTQSPGRHHHQPPQQPLRQHSRGGLSPTNSLRNDGSHNGGGAAVLGGIIPRGRANSGIAALSASRRTSEIVSGSHANSLSIGGTATAALFATAPTQQQHQPCFGANTTSASFSPVTRGLVPPTATATTPQHRSQSQPRGAYFLTATGQLRRGSLGL